MGERLAAPSPGRGSQGPPSQPQTAQSPEQFYPGPGLLQWQLRLWRVHSRKEPRRKLLPRLKAPQGPKASPAKQLPACPQEERLPRCLASLAPGLLVSLLRRKLLQSRFCLHPGQGAELVMAQRQKQRSDLGLARLEVLLRFYESDWLACLGIEAV